MSQQHRDSADHHPRSEEHTSELQSRFDLVCRLLLEKKKSAKIPPPLSRRRPWYGGPSAACWARASGSCSTACPSSSARRGPSLSPASASFIPAVTSA